MAFLDETGLARFLADLKTWFSSYGSAATATKATQDGDGKVISSTYLKLSGGTMAGDLSVPDGRKIQLDVSASAPTSGTPRALPLVVKSQAAGTGYQYSKAILFEAPVTQSYANGEGIILCGGGLTVVGGGEAGVDIVSAENIDGSSEKVVIASDNQIEFFTNCNTIANRVKTAIDSSGAFSGSAAKLTTARKLKTKLDSTSDATFDGSAAQEAIPVTGVLPVANGGTGSSAKNFVDLTTNQSIEGYKTFTGTVQLPLNVRGPAGNEGFNITAGSTYYAGARLRLYGASSESYPGGFTLAACLDQNTQAGLYGAPDGTLTWNDKDITGDVHSTGNETIAGNKTFTGTIYLPTDVRGPSGNAGFNITGGSTYYAGARLMLGGASASANAGGFNLVACVANASGSYKWLSGKVDGTLTWDGQSIQTTSDERLKTPVSTVPDDVLDAWGDVQWGQFQFLEAVQEKGETARLHLGLIAQRVKAAFDARGLDACKYGILCHEERGATEDRPAVDLWMVRYAEAQAMEAAFQRRRADRLEARIAALEERTNG